MSDDPDAPYGRKKDGSPKKPSGFQRGGSQYRPPTNGSKGDGWGGAAKGPGSAVPVGPKPENLTKGGVIPDEVKAAKAEREAAKQARAERMLDLIGDIADGKPPGAATEVRVETQLTAAIAYRTHVVGPPKTTIAHVGGGADEPPIDLSIDMSSLTNDQLAAIASIKVRPG